MGVLNDWDHAEENSAGSTHAIFRTVSSVNLDNQSVYLTLPQTKGTWQFMSVAMHKDLLKEHTVLDDLEQFHWNLLAISAYWFKAVTPFDLDMFDQWRPKNIDGKIYIVGGDNKTSYLFNRDYEDTEFECKPLMDLLRELGSAWRTYYGLQGVQRHLPGAHFKFAEHEAKLMKVSFWEEIFNRHLARDDWEEHDAVPDQQPWQIKKKYEEYVRRGLAMTVIATESVDVCAPTANREAKVEESPPASPVEKDLPSSPAERPPETGDHSTFVGDIARPVDASLDPSGIIQGSCLRVHKRSAVEVYEGEAKADNPESPPKQKKMKTRNSNVPVGEVPTENGLSIAEPQVPGSSHTEDRGLTREIKGLPTRARTLTGVEPELPAAGK